MCLTFVGLVPSLTKLGCPLFPPVGTLYGVPTCHKASLFADTTLVSVEPLPMGYAANYEVRTFPLVV